MPSGQQQLFRRAGKTGHPRGQKHDFAREQESPRKFVVKNSSLQSRIKQKHAYP
jgi:hypothetical protein